MFNPSAAVLGVIQELKILTAVQRVGQKAADHTSSDAAWDVTNTVNPKGTVAGLTELGQGSVSVADFLTLYTNGACTKDKILKHIADFEAAESTPLPTPADASEGCGFWLTVYAEF